MPINRLDHVNLATAQLDAMIEWYTTIVGLHVGYRPDFGFPGAWLYAGDQAVVHLVGRDDTELVGSEVPLKFEHVAFSATGRTAFEAKLDEAGEQYRTGEPPSINIVQYNLWDPDGNHIHIDFSLDE